MIVPTHILLDRDGTVIRERHYLASPEQLELLPGAAEGLRAMQQAGFRLALVTNQSGVGRGYFSMERLEEIHARLGEMLAAHDVALDGIYVCPHTPDDNCGCRKPLPGLIEQAAGELGFDPRAAVVIGDKPCDIDLGRAVGARTILVRTGYGAGHESDPALRPDHVVDDLAAAARIVAALRHPASSTAAPRSA